MFLDESNYLGQSLLRDSQWTSPPTTDSLVPGRHNLPWPVDGPNSIPATNYSKLSISTNIITQNSTDILTSVATYQSDGVAVLADLLGFSISLYADFEIVKSNLFPGFRFYDNDDSGMINDTLETSSLGGFVCEYNTAIDAPALRIFLPNESPYLPLGNLSLACISPDGFALAQYNSSVHNLTLEGITGIYNGM